MKLQYNINEKYYIRYKVNIKKKMWYKSVDIPSLVRYNMYINILSYYYLYATSS